MQSYSIREAQTRLATLVEQAAQGTPFIIARDDGEPLVKVAAFAVRQDEPSLGRRRCGFLKGRIKVPDDFDRMYEKEIAEMFGVNE